MSLPVPGRFGDLGGVGVLAQGDGAGAQLLLGMPEDFMYGFHVWVSCISLSLEHTNTH